MAELTPFEAAILQKTPQQLFTSGYLDDPIQFTSDVRLSPTVLIKQENLYTIVDRDQADFAMINLAATASVFYPIETTSPTYDRVKFTQQMKPAFTTF